MNNSEMLRHVVDGTKIDPHGHLHHPAWEEILETARLQASIKTRESLDNTPLRHIKIEYRAQIFEGDELYIFTSVSKDDPIVFNQYITGENKGDDGKACQASSKYSLTVPTIKPLVRPFSTPAFELDKEFNLPNGELHHIAALHYFEWARMHFLRTRDLNIKDLIQELNIRPMVYLLKATFAESMHPGQIVWINNKVHVFTLRPLIKFNQQTISKEGIINESESLYVLIGEDDKPLNKVPFQLLQQLIGDPVRECPFTSDLRWDKKN